MHTLHRQCSSFETPMPNKQAAISTRGKKKKLPVVCKGPTRKQGTKCNDFALELADTTNGNACTPCNQTLKQFAPPYHPCFSSSQPTYPRRHPPAIAQLHDPELHLVWSTGSHIHRTSSMVHLRLHSQHLDDCPSDP